MKKSINAVSLVVLLVMVFATSACALEVTVTPGAFKSTSGVGGNVEANIKTDGAAVNVGVGVTNSLPNNAQFDHAIDAGVGLEVPVGPAVISGSAKVTNFFVDDVQVPVFEIGGGVGAAKQFKAVNVGGAVQHMMTNTPIGTTHNTSVALGVGTPAGSSFTVEKNLTNGTIAAEVTFPFP